MLERTIISVTTPALGKLLVPVATVRSELGITGTDSDTKITRLLNAIGREFAGVHGLRRPLLRQTYLERLRLHDHQDPLEGNLMSLGRWPIESVTSVTDTATVPVAVTSTDYSIAGDNRSALYNPTGWTPDFDYLATYIAGWLPLGDGPGLLMTWSAAAVKVANSWAKPLAAANGSISLLFQCTTAGTTHATTEPTWPTTAGGTVTDGTVVWTARAANELPEDIQEAAIVTAYQWFNGALQLQSGIQSESADGFEVAYDFVGLRTGITLPPFARAVLEGYR